MQKNIPVTITKVGNGFLVEPKFREMGTCIAYSDMMVFNELGETDGSASEIDISVFNFLSEHFDE